MFDCRHVLLLFLEGRKCLFNDTLNIFYLWKEGSVLFSDALNTFYLWLKIIRHIVKVHSDSEKENLLLPPHGLLFLINSKK